MKVAAFLLCSVVLSSAAFAAAPFSGTVRVFQNDPANNASSVDLRLSPATSPGVVIHYPSSNRGDYVVGVPAADDVMEGVLLSCVANNGRNHGDGIQYATSGTAIGAGIYWIPVHRAPTGAEFNADTAFAWFDYAHWLGAATQNSGGSLSLFSGSPGIAMGSQLIDHGNGTSTVNLTSLGAHSADGVLLVNSVANSGKFALSRANADGTFTVFNHDNATNGAVYEQGAIAFAYVAAADVGSKGLVAMGRVKNDGSTDVAGGAFTITKPGVGRWLLTIPGHSPATGTLFISPAGGEPFNSDNVVSYQATGNQWEIQSRDLVGMGLQDGGTADETMFNFAFFEPQVPYAGPQRIIHVDPAATGSGDGTGWTDAMTDLRLALAAAYAGDEVWVARGTYHPSPGTGRADTFTIHHGITVLGGFEPGMDDPSQRQIHREENRTVLSGNIGNPAQNTDNLFHVLTVRKFSGTLTLDGFVIRDGNRSANAGQELAAGMQGGAGLAVEQDGGTLVVRNCSFRDNIARGRNGTANGEEGTTVLGGAVYAPVAARFENCLFVGNEVRGGNGATSGSINFAGAAGGDARGGAVWTLSGEFLNCYFEWNRAFGGQGGGGRVGTNGASPGASGLNGSSGGSGGNAWGGAIDAAAGFVKESYFHGNHARAGAGGAGGRGGHGAAGTNGANGTNSDFSADGGPGGNGGPGGAGRSGGDGGPSGSARGGAFHGLTGFGGQPIEDCVFVGNTAASAPGGAGGNGGNRGKGGNGGDGGYSVFGNGGRGGNGGTTGSSGSGGNGGPAGDATGGAVHFADARLKLLNENTFAHNLANDRGSGGAGGSVGQLTGIGAGGSGGTSTFGSAGMFGSNGLLDPPGSNGAAGAAGALDGGAVFAVEVEPGNRVQTYNSIYWKNLKAGTPGHFGGAKPGGSSGTNFASDAFALGLGDNFLTSVIHGFVREPTSGSGWDQAPGDNDYGDLRRYVHSLGTNAGVNTDSFQTASSTDIAGHPRILNGTISLGAYELEVTTFEREYPWLSNMDDTNRDGFSNFVNYLRAVHPTGPPDQSRLGELTLIDGQMKVHFRRRPNAIDGAEYYEGSTDLIHWTVLEAGVDYVESSTFTGVAVEDVEMTILVDPGPQWFWRRVFVAP